MSNYKRTNGEDVYPVAAYLTESQKLKFKTYCAANKVTMSKLIKDFILGEISESRTF